MLDETAGNEVEGPIKRYETLPNLDASPGIHDGTLGMEDEIPGIQEETLRQEDETLPKPDGTLSDL